MSLNKSKLPEVDVHGSYPLDGDRWEIVAILKPKEAMKLINRPDLEAVAPEGKVDSGAHDVWPKFYPWVNKGYHIFNQKMPKVSLTEMMLMEILTNGEVGTSLVVPGKTEAVFLADGEFIHIRAK